MAASVVQISARATYPGSGGSGVTSATTLSGVTAGNQLTTINCAGASPASSAPNISVSDGTAYTVAQQAAFNYSSSNYVQPAVHFLPNASSGTHTTTSTNNNANTFSAYGFSRTLELAGMPTSGALDAAPAAATGTGQTVTCPSSGTLAQAAEIAFAAFVVSGGTNITITEPSGFTNIDSANTTAAFGGVVMGSMDYDIVNATTALAPTYGSTGVTVNGWAALTVTFKAAATGSKWPQTRKRLNTLLRM